MEDRAQKLMEIIEQTKVILIRSKLEYCFKFFSKFTPTEAEIIYFISLNDDMTFKGSYSDNFMSLLNADDIGVENLRAKKVST